MGSQEGRGSMREGGTAIPFKRCSTHSSDDEWLGAESHVPNLSWELRRREPRRTGLTSGWVASVIFAAGVATGYLVVHLVHRRFRPS